MVIITLLIGIFIGVLGTIIIIPPLDAVKNFSRNYLWEMTRDEKFLESMRNILDTMSSDDKFTNKEVTDMASLNVWLNYPNVKFEDTSEKPLEYTLEKK